MNRLTNNKAWFFLLWVTFPIFAEQSPPDQFDEKRAIKEQATPVIDLQEPILKADKPPHLPQTSTLSSTESEAITQAEEALATQNFALYQELRQQWEGKSKENSAWFFLDVEEHLLQGDTRGAIQKLNSQVLKGNAEAQRLVRLAALYLLEDPKRSINYLKEAIRKDPTNPDFHLFLAEVLESLNDHSQALQEYIAAVRTDTTSPHLREQLAEFYLRNAHYIQALHILQDTLSPPTLDTIWLKTLFWSRMISPINQKWKLKGIPKSDLTPFIAYLNALPNDVYWDEQAFLRVPDYEKYLKTRQETFWLRLIQMLKEGDTSTALKLLQANPFQYLSWAPDLEKALITVLTYQSASSKELKKNHESPRASDDDHISPQEFLKALAAFSSDSREQIIKKLPDELQIMAFNADASALLFLAAGWQEVALQLNHLTTIPHDFPSWVAYGLTEALRHNRGATVAIDFALKQQATPQLSLLIAETALHENLNELAIKELRSIYREEGAIGKQATLLLAQQLIMQDDLKEAKAILEERSDLQEDVLAREFLARIAIRENNPDVAYNIYLGLENQSSEAKSFLAHKAFVEKDWPRARELTEELLKEYPDNTTLQENLEKIINEQRKEKSS